MSRLGGFLFRAVCGTRARWQGCDPAGHQRIYFANHTSHLDAVLLWATLPPTLRARTRPVAARDYWAASRLRLWSAEKVFHALLIERRKVTTQDNPLRDMLTSDAGQQKLVKTRALADLAAKAGLPLAHLCLLWCLANPRVSTVILGASRASQLTDNLAALDHKAKLTPEVMAEIEVIMANKPAAPQRF